MAWAAVVCAVVADADVVVACVVAVVVCVVAAVVAAVVGDGVAFGSSVVKYSCGVAAPSNTENRLKEVDLGGDNPYNFGMGRLEALHGWASESSSGVSPGRDSRLQACMRDGTIAKW